MGTRSTTFRAKLDGSAESAASWVIVPPAVMARFGGRVRVRIRATINGFTWRTTIANMGAGPMIGVTAATRAAAGIKRGDRLTIALQEDTQERVVDTPADFAKAMTKAQRRKYDSMSYTHRKEYVVWIEGAKKPETRQRRIALACAKLAPQVDIG
jgi:hypothetical protein